MGTSADLLTRGIPHRNRKQRHRDFYVVCQSDTGRSGGSRRCHQPDDVHQHPNGTSGDVRQPPLRQGGRKNVTADGHKEPPRGTQKLEGRNVQPQEVKPLRRRRRRSRLQRQWNNGPQVEKIRTVPPPHLVEHHVLLEPWGGRPSMIIFQ